MSLEYNPQNVIVTWGPITLQGAAEDIVTVEFDEAAVTKTIGAQGEIAWTVNANKGGKATYSMLQGSPTNALLSALCASVRGDRSPLVIYPFIVADLGGTTLAVGPQAVIEKVPPISFKKGQAAHDWVFSVGKWTKLINGGVLP